MGRTVPISPGSIVDNAAMDWIMSVFLQFDIYFSLEVSTHSNEMIARLYRSQSILQDILGIDFMNFIMVTWAPVQ